MEKAAEMMQWNKDYGEWLDSKRLSCNDCLYETDEALRTVSPCQGNRNGSRVCIKYRGAGVESTLQRLMEQEKPELARKYTEIWRITLK